VITPFGDGAKPFGDGAKPFGDDAKPFGSEVNLLPIITKGTVSEKIRHRKPLMHI
jgi:hypothetical protein